jgi:hypothetical protein
MGSQLTSFANRLTAILEKSVDLCANWQFLLQHQLARTVKFLAMHFFFKFG